MGTVCGAIQDLPWRNISSADNPVDVLNEHLLQLVGHFVPTMVIRVRNKEMPWFDDQCRHAFGLKQDAHLRWTRNILLLLLLKNVGNAGLAESD